jgi:DNA-binding FrmR family transcriptional regulator
MSDQATAHFRHSYTKDRSELLNRLRRVEGQVRGIQGLVEHEAYWLVLEDHVDGCLTHAIESGQGQPYVDEVMQVVRRAVGRPMRRRTTGRKAARTA